jgi:hypothetical protein
MSKKEIIKKFFKQIKSLMKDKDVSKTLLALRETLSSNKKLSKIRESLDVAEINLMLKDVWTHNDKRLAYALVMLSYDLSSEDLKSALKKDKDLEKFCKTKLWPVVKILITVGIALL